MLTWWAMQPCKPPHSMQPCHACPVKLQLLLAQQDEQRSCHQLGSSVSPQAVVWLLRGRAHEALEDRTRAAACYREALQQDPYCYDAFRCALGNHADPHGWGGGEAIGRYVRRLLLQA